MEFMLLGTFASTFLGWMMGFLSLFLVLLILIQRGKGGGLTGALGGPGGQSAFGSKAGDTFTFITIVVASIWGFTCAFAMWLLGAHTPAVIVDRPTETTVEARPGDDTNNPLIPPLTGSESSSIGGIGALDMVDAVVEEPAATETATETATDDQNAATNAENTAEDSAASSERSPTEEPDADEPDADEPDADEPDAGKPDADEPDADEPDAGKPESGEPESSAASED